MDAMNRANRRDRVRRTWGALSDGAYRTLSRMADVWGGPDNRMLWPSQTVIATRLDRNVRTIRRHLAEAESVGAVKVWRSEPRHDRSGHWTRRTNRYCAAKPQVAPSGHSCPHNQSKKEPRRGAALAVAPSTPAPERSLPMANAPNPRCSDCDGTGWRDAGTLVDYGNRRLPRDDPRYNGVRYSQVEPCPCTHPEPQGQITMRELLPEPYIDLRVAIAELRAQRP